MSERMPKTPLKAEPNTSGTLQQDAAPLEREDVHQDIQNLMKASQANPEPPPPKQAVIMRMQRKLGNQATQQLLRKTQSPRTARMPETGDGLLRRKTTHSLGEWQAGEHANPLQREGETAKPKKKTDDLGSNQNNPNPANSTESIADAGADPATQAAVQSDYDATEAVRKDLSQKSGAVKVQLVELQKMIDAMASLDGLDKNSSKRALKARLRILHDVFERRKSAITDARASARSELEAASKQMDRLNHAMAQPHIDRAKGVNVTLVETLDRTGEAAHALQLIYNDKSCKALRPAAVAVGDLNERATKVRALTENAQAALPSGWEQFKALVKSVGSLNSVLTLNATDDGVPEAIYLAQVAAGDKDFESGESVVPGNPFEAGGDVNPNATAKGGVSDNPEVGFSGGGGDPTNAEDAGKADKSRLSDAMLGAFKSELGELTASASVVTVVTSLGRIVQWLEYLGVIDAVGLGKAVYTFKQKRNLSKALDAGRKATDEQVDAFESSGLTDDDADSATDMVRANQAFNYGAAKVARAFRGSVVNLLSSLSKTIGRIILIASGGMASIASFALGVASAMQKLGSGIFHAGKAIYKAIKGTRGVNRAENATEMVDVASHGQAEAIDFMVKGSIFDNFVSTLSGDDAENYKDWKTQYGTDYEKLIGDIILNGHRDALETVVAKALKSTA